MVATDVASRGIGMLDRIFFSFPLLSSLPIFSLLLTLCGLMWIVALSTMDGCVHSCGLGSCSLLGSSCQSSHRVLLQCSLLHSSFRLATYHTGTEADWTFLDLFKLHAQGSSGP